MPKLYNLARMTTATVGAGTITLGVAVSGYLTFALAGVANGDIVDYAIADGANSEIGVGTYTSAGTTLSRNVTKSTNSNAAISLSGTAQVFITPRAETLILPRSYLAGLTLSTAGSSTSFGVAAGQAVDSTNLDGMTLASAYTKTTSAWAVGTGNGSLDTGSIAASTWYHAYLIKRLDTAVVDVLISLSASAPTMPSGYTLSRRIGPIKTNGSSQWTSFLQVDDVFYYAAVTDYSATSARAIALLTLSTVPLGISVQPLLAIQMQQSGVNGDTTVAVAPGANSALLYTALQTNLLSDRQACSFEGPHSNTSAQINMSVAIGSGALASMVFQSRGFVDTRGKTA